MKRTGDSFYRQDPEDFSGGFTLIEFVIAIAASTLVVAAAYILLISQQRHYKAQSQVTEMQQNLRSGTSMMQYDLRLVGYEPKDDSDDSFDLMDITRRGLDYNTANVNGNATIQFRADLNEDGKLDDPGETITYSLADFPDNNAAERDGVPDLTRSTNSSVATGTNRKLVAENIEALGIAYAFDTNGDGKLDTSANGHVIWAVDTDNDNRLDKGLDKNDDGVIDAADAGGSSINSAPFNMGSDPPLAYIRSARVWALARAGDGDENFSNSTTYVVADRLITPSDDLRRRLLEFTVYFRNTGI